MNRLCAISLIYFHRSLSFSRTFHFSSECFFFFLLSLHHLSDISVAMNLLHCGLHRRMFLMCKQTLGSESADTGIRGEELTLCAYNNDCSAILLLWYLNNYETESCANIHGAYWINPIDFGEPLTVDAAPGQSFHSSTEIVYCVQRNSDSFLSWLSVPRGCIWNFVYTAMFTG